MKTTTEKSSEKMTHKVKYNSLAEVLTDITEVLNRQLTMVTSNRLDNIGELSKQLDWLLDEATSRHDELNESFTGPLENIKNLYSKLQLAVATEKQVVEGQRQKVNNGKQTVRAYTQGSGLGGL